MSTVIADIYILDKWDGKDNLNNKYISTLKKNNIGTCKKFTPMADSRLSLQSGKIVRKEWYSIVLLDPIFKVKIIPNSIVFVIFFDNPILGKYLKVFTGVHKYDEEYTTDTSEFETDLGANIKEIKSFAFFTENYPLEYKIENNEYVLNRNAVPDGDGWYKRLRTGILSGELVDKIVVDTIEWRKKAALELGFSEKEINVMSKQLENEKYKRNKKFILEDKNNEK